MAYNREHDISVQQQRTGLALKCICGWRKMVTESDYASRTLMHQEADRLREEHGRLQTQDIATKAAVTAVEALPKTSAGIRSMRIVVTGVVGFIGSHFAERARSEGHEVIGIWFSRAPSKNALKARLTERGIILVEGDVLKPETLYPAFLGADCVCHFAAAFRESGVSDEHFRRTNVAGTLNVLTQAAKANVQRLVMCSTAGIYGKSAPGVIDEAYPVQPWNIYEQSKVEAEEVIRTRAPQLGLEYVILRPTSVYGPRDERLLKLFRSAARGHFPVFGSGNGRRNLIYVSDVSNAFLKACLCEAAASQELIVAGTVSVPLKTLLQELARVVGRPRVGPKLPLKPMLWLSAFVEDVCKVLKISPPLYRRRMDFYVNDTVYTTAKAKAILNWEAEVDLREGLSKTYSAYVEDGRIKAGSALPHLMGIIAMVTNLDWPEQLLAAIGSGLPGG